jgi:hypothetical protein
MLQKAVMMNPESLDGWYNFGAALEASEMLSEALYCYEWGAALGDEEAVDKSRALRDQGVKPQDPTIAYEAEQQKQEQIKQRAELERRKMQEQLDRQEEQARQAQSFGLLLDKLKKLVRVSRHLKIEQVAKYLGVSADELFPRLVDWAADFGFILDRDEIDFEGSQVEAFITQLDEEFAAWGDEGKIENEES